MSADLEGMDGGGLMAAAAGYRDRGDLGAARQVFEYGMRKFPGLLDRFGHPLFHKELLRMLVNAGDFATAGSIVPHPGGIGGDRWHHVLFARAHASRNDRRNAGLWWRKLLEHDRHNGEALTWLFNDRNGGRQRGYPPPFMDMVTRCADLQMETMFDVGANDGQSCLSYTQLFPLAQIHSFEPVPATFDRLAGNAATFPNIHPVNLAFGDADGTLEMRLEGQSTMNRAAAGGGGNTVSVKVARIDTFCADRGIGRINFLKVDTEGHDLSVLRGCGDFIANIDFIQCEASANAYNTYHNAYADIFLYLTSRSFHLFGIYGQTFEWTGRGYPVCRRFDPVFINSRIVGPMPDVVAS